MATTNQPQLDPTTHYKEELELLDQALAEIEDLYEETKSHFDVVKNSRTKGSLSFVHLQTGNLISLKGSKFQILKEKVSIKKSIADFTMKQKAAADGENKDKETIRQLMNALIKHDTTPEMKDIQYEDEESTTDIDSTLDRQIAMLEDQGKIVFTDNDRAAKYEKMGGTPSELPSDEEEEDELPASQKTKIAVRVKDKKWSFVAVNEMGQIVKGVEVPDKKKYKMKLTKVDGERVAIDQDDRMYEVIG
jgi:hypothetical protein